MTACAAQFVKYPGYFPGRDTVCALHGGTGSAFSVEQQLAPQIELAGDGVASEVALEVSLDGLGWTKVAGARYRLGAGLRQSVTFSFTSTGEEFRFVRVRQPRSATQGLSGDLDHSQLVLDVTAVSSAPPIALTAQPGATKTCGADILEDVWPRHPCTYGGIDRYDSPSFLHTYPLGDARLDAVRGSATLAYFRPEDPGTCCGQSVAGMLDGRLLVQGAPTGWRGRSSRRCRSPTARPRPSRCPVSPVFPPGSSG